MKRVAVSLLLVVTATAGCGASSNRVIAWRAERPPVPPAPPLAAPCRAQDLKAAGLNDWNGATGSLVGGIGVTNVSGHACSLLGVPRIRIPGARVHAHSIPAYGDDPLNRPPLSSLRALAPGKSAGLMLIWSEWCGRPPGLFLVTLPGSRSTLRLPSSNAPRCNPPDSSAQTDVAIAHWVPAPLPDSPAVPLRVESLGPSHPQGIGREVVYHVRRGGVLRYEVALINVSGKPFTFNRCPIYTVTANRTEGFVLNCRPMGTLRAGHRAVFEMKLRVNGPIGGFLWELYTGNAPGDHANVVVTR